jgi:hypothetical protein
MLALVPSSLGLLLSLGMNYVPFVETSEVAHPNSRWSARSRCELGCAFYFWFLVPGGGCPQQLAPHTSVLSKSNCRGLEAKPH